ncbi:hypothetical protein Acr_12g0008310 [Actinidia rufa]|uniref:Leucine-rich repeat-containing N-terminal plant-type domain-containing protein n=1 Tax=Actinidia rufa TaxID=165716 RepID=A0A7J0FHW7_9ERIC|nr:hypothetical protein Acr_12g0008310 [Actinidia rufa]
MKSTTAISLLLFLSLLSPSLSDRCNPNDKKVLLRIKQALNNPYLLASWNPANDCCDWYNVDCDLTTNRIIALTIFSAGPIYLALSLHFFSQLKNLTFLDLSFNDLTGSIPSSLSKLTNLDAIHLDRNKLTGPIPNSFGEFTGQVPDLYLSHNQLTGSIPKTLGDLNFTVIDVSRNMLSGDISFMFGSNKTIQIVDFSRNKFQFDLSKVVFPQSLTSLDLNHNKIYGSLPVGLTTLDLQYLNVSYNRLCGHIPTGGKLQSFDQTSYFHNRCLCGAPLPDCK